MAKFSLRMYTSRLLPMGVQDFMGKSEYVRSSDIGVRKPISDVKTPKTSTSASAAKEYFKITCRIMQSSTNVVD